MMPPPQRPQTRPGVLAIDPYVPGKSTAPGVARIFKLSSNETPLGPSPKAMAAYRAAIALSIRLLGPIGPTSRSRGISSIRWCCRTSDNG